MKKSRFTKEQIVFALKQAELGTSVPDVCRKQGISDATFYTWRKKYGGISPSEFKHMRQLEEENLLSRVFLILAFTAGYMVSAHGDALCY
jgi:putative transposase